MGYCTTDDLENWIGEETLARLTTESQEDIPASYSEEIADDAIDQASSLMDTYLCAQFSVPVDVTTSGSVHATLAGVLKMHCIALVHHLLYRNLKGEDVPARVKAAQDLAMEWLNGVREGSIALPTADSDSGGTVGFAKIYRGDETYLDEAEEEEEE